MSVLVSKRNESRAEFLTNAMQIEMQTFLKTIKFPKRWEVLARRLEDLAIQIVNEVMVGNQIYLCNSQSVEERATHFNSALFAISCLITQIEFCRERGITKNLTSKQWETWLEPITKEVSLLNNVKKSDLKRVE